MEQFIKFGNARLQISVPEHVDESGDRISFWWGVTTASLNLTRQVLEGDNLTGKKVLELGCGIGLSGIGALKRGARVTFSDYVPEALEWARRNVSMNSLDLAMTEFLNLDWEFLPTKIPLFDLIIGAEIVYDYFYHSSLIRLIEQMLAPGGRIILADRKRLVVERFVGRLISKGFASKEKLCHLYFEGFPKQETTIFEITRKLK